MPTWALLNVACSLVSGGERRKERAKKKMDSADGGERPWSSFGVFRGAVVLVRKKGSDDDNHLVDLMAKSGARLWNSGLTLTVTLIQYDTAACNEHCVVRQVPFHVFVNTGSTVAVLTVIDSSMHTAFAPSGLIN